jgi:hypothetical protein
MLFVGYPVSYETACDLFNIPTHDDYKILSSLVSKVGLKFERVDKNLCILGLEVKEITQLWDTYTSVDESIILIMKYKLKFVELVQKSGIDVSELEIERMEDEPLRVNNPPPYLITV